ncbi:MAG: polysaccharide biosynthesis/export family protein [Verrucomicrobiota bacterium]|nr:polysaccharide biosynthesis/export family protein [Verrucomicrobiota bacterium]
MADLNDAYPLAVGDRVSYRVLEDSNPPASLIVTDSGEMEVPLVGRVRAANKSCKKLAFEIKTALEREFFKRATVLIGVDIIGPPVVKRLNKVLITGAVRSQGELALPPDEPLTVSRAILQMGGFAEFAKDSRVEIIRKGEKDGKKRKIEVDVGKVLKGKSDYDPVLEKGDHVIVSERFFNF